MNLYAIVCAYIQRNTLLLLRRDLPPALRAALRANNEELRVLRARCAKTLTETGPA